MVLVRILRIGEDPNQAVGLIGNPISMPSDRQIVARIKTTYRNVIQISVHGKESPFGIFLKNQNGPATLEFAEIIECSNNND